ncbi:hypothetical protein [Halanaerobacter jeridensis]|uniref:Uncharacterized protein n=1 Tax=Halanaerobacter jeridensis TaxID=706427 RepID=A0A938XTZ4_9FIRM|nr:hypothetical protein [Halanaerobacter jeridensis]MBM7557485.1 hypothetical protein [Halanaerobacter jeridensis]
MGKLNLKPAIYVILIILILPSIIGDVTSYFGYHNKEDVRAKMKSHLYQKYGKEFMVDRIGTRSSRGQVFYQARIYPKAIIGSKKQWDDYYYASATVDKLSYGRLGEVGDSYSYVARNIDLEKYLLPQVKSQFGERVLLKVDVEHKVTGDGSWWAGYKSKSLKEMRKEVNNDPEHNRIELNLDVYVFDRIENQTEKEKRRKDIFEFVQYLKDEGFFEYLELGIIFVDERVLAPSYEDFKYEIKNTYQVKEEIDEKEVVLPPMKLRKEFSKKLQKEIDEMSQKELVEKINQIKKSNANNLIENNGQKATYIYSWGMIKEKYSSSIEDRDRNRDYSKLKHVRLGNNLKYIYKN